MKYILSRFTKTILDENTDNIIIYNTITGKQSYIYDNEIKKQLKEIQKTSIEENMLNDKFREYYCCKENCNEIKIINEIKKQKTQNKDQLSLIIIPTLDCNFNCIYCYEKKEKGNMSEETLENIYKAIVHQYEHYGLKSIKLDWFGGEPMLFFTKMIYMTNKINHFCKEHEIQISHGITTNGYYLTPEKVNQLIGASIKTFQVTIDGNAETHNTYRKNKSGLDSWKIIIDNLAAMSLRNDEFRVVIRVNYNYEVLEGIEDLLEELKNKFSGDKRFEICFKAIGHWGGDKDDTFTIVPIGYQNFIHLEMLKKLEELSL